jgi:hypothetical protein
MFAMTADGGHLPSTLTLPNNYDLKSLSKFRDEPFVILQSARGWWEKDLFEYEMRNIIIPYVKRMQDKATEGESTRALLILDGHASRQNLALWKEFAELGIDVVTLPAHTSHILPPLQLK